MVRFAKTRHQIEVAGLFLIANLAAIAASPASENAASEISASGSHDSEQSATQRYEAEAGKLGGAAKIVGLPDGSDRQVGDLGGEASHRQAVTLANIGDSVTLTPRRDRPAANALVVRYSLPDAHGGGGATGTLSVSIVGADGIARLTKTLTLTSRYAWLYGSVAGGTHLYNIPADAQRQLGASGPTHLYDEIQLYLGKAIRPGETVRLEKAQGDSHEPDTIDFVELEAVPPPLPQPDRFISLLDPRCGALEAPRNASDSSFDGQDDSSYGSVFNSAYDIPTDSNPYNPVPIFIPEKSWYGTAPSDALQDTLPNSTTHGLSLFELADHNYQSLSACIAEVTRSAGALRGVYVPPGRFYARGGLVLPSNIRIQGAGMWYSKFVAVDTAAPQPADIGEKSGYAGLTGNLIFLSQPTTTGNGSSNVHLSHFSLFGNVTQRDSVDFPYPMGVHGQFTDSVFDHLWVEHYVIGINFNGNSSHVHVADSRVRNTFADGIDFYGSTSHSTIERSQARSTGDDGFAIWSQGIETTAPDIGNRITRSEAQLQWYGDGFAIYGGTDNEISFSDSADILNYPCLQASTQFVPADLTGAPMTAAFSHLNLDRCGGNGFSQRFGALLLGVYLENIDGIVLRDIHIAEPTYGGIDIRPIPGNSAHEVVATIDNAWFKNVTLTQAATCGNVRPFTGGQVRLDNVCVCQASSSTPESCTLNNASPTTFQPYTIGSLQCEFLQIGAPN